MRRCIFESVLWTMWERNEAQRIKVYCVWKIKKRERELPRIVAYISAYFLFSYIENCRMKIMVKP